MTWTRAVIAVVAVAGVGYVAMRPEDEAEYLGDFPSIFESAEQAPAATPDPPVRHQAPYASTVSPPVVTRPEAPPADPGYTGGFRPDQGPGADTSLPVAPGVSEGDDIGPAPDFPGLPSVPRLPLPLCADDFFQPGVGLISCLTGEVLVPDLPVPDPTSPLAGG